MIETATGVKQRETEIREVLAQPSPASSRQASPGWLEPQAAKPRPPAPRKANGRTGAGSLSAPARRASLPRGDLGEKLPGVGGISVSLSARQEGQRPRESDVGRRDSNRPRGFSVLVDGMGPKGTAAHARPGLRRSPQPSPGFSSSRPRRRLSRRRHTCHGLHASRPPPEAPSPLLAPGLSKPSPAATASACASRPRKRFSVPPPKPPMLPGVRQRESGVRMRDPARGGAPGAHAEVSAPVQCGLQQVRRV